MESQDKGGMNAFKERMQEGGAGPDPDPAKPKIVEPTEPQRLDPQFVEPTAQLSTEELIARQNADPSVNPKGAAAPVSDPVVQAKPGLDSRENQAEVDRLRQRVIDLQQDALYGSFVKNDPYLMRVVTDSMNGKKFVPMGEAGVDVRPGISEMAGLPADFVPDPDEVLTEGTNSWKWNQKKQDLDFEERMQTVFQAQEQNRIKEAVSRERQSYLDEGHSDMELDALLKWTSNPENFSLRKLNFYKTQIEGVQGSTGQIRGEPKEHVASIGAAPGGAIPRETTPEESTKLGLQKLAKSAKNPLIGG